MNDEVFNFNEALNYYQFSLDVHKNVHVFIKQYIDITKEYFRKLRNLSDKTIPKLKKNDQYQSDHVLLSLTTAILKLIEIQTSTENLLEQIISKVNNSEDNVNNLTNELYQYNNDYRQLLKELEYKHKEQEKIKKDYMSEAEYTENQLIKIKKEINKNKQLSLNKTDLKQNKSNITNSNENETNLKLINSSIEICFPGKVKETSDLLNNLKYNQKVYLSNINTYNKYIQEFHEKMNKLIKSSINTSVNCANELCLIMNEVINYNQSSFQIIMNENNTLQNEIKQIQINEELSTKIRSFFKMGNVSWFPLSEDYYQIKVIDDYNKNKKSNTANINEITGEDVKDIINSLSNIISIKTNSSKDNLNDEVVPEFEFDRLINFFVIEDEQNIKQTLEDKSIMLTCLDDVKYRILFFNMLNSLRGTGKTKLSYRKYRLYGEFLFYLLHSVIKEEDYFTAKNIIDLSVILYTEDSKYNINNKKKKYLKNIIKKHPIMKESFFWNEFAEFYVYNEISSSIEKGGFLYSEDQEESMKFQLDNIVFPQLAGVTNTMNAFGFKAEKIMEMLEPTIKHFNLGEMYVENIKEMLIDSEKHQESEESDDDDEVYEKKVPKENDEQENNEKQDENKSEKMNNDNQEENIKDNVNISK